MRYQELLAALTVTVAATVALGEVPKPSRDCSIPTEEPETIDAAIRTLKARLLADRMFASSPEGFKSMFFDGYLLNDLAFYVEIRANPNCRPGTEASLFGAFLVFPRSDVILWNYSPENAWQSWERFLKCERATWGK
ncbi:MAG: hypothetical protein ACHQQS_05165 [Thermoanaerobaculales bacterium]